MHLGRSPWNKIAFFFLGEGVVVVVVVVVVAVAAAAVVLFVVESSRIWVCCEATPLGFFFVAEHSHGQSSS